MKIFKNILFTLFIVLLASSVKAISNTLTIDDKSYDESTNVFTVSGTSSYSDVMVSLFDGEELLSFKTVKANDNKYTAIFNIAFDEDKTVTIKVGDINSTNYEISTLDAKKSIEPVKSSKLTDEYGNTLTYLDSLKKFEIGDNLVIQIIDDFDNLNEEDQAKLEAVNEKLGLKKDLFAVMIVMVVNGQDEVELPDLIDGYELFINTEGEETLSLYAKPYMARLFDGEELEIEDGKQIAYDSDREGYIAKLNNAGIYVLYDDISIEYKFLDNTDNQTYYNKKDDTLTLRIDADYSKFVCVYMDGELVDPKNYTSKEGSTIITFTKEYLKSLSVGTHNVKIDFTDGEANTTLVITATNPKTGDNILMYVFILLVATFGVCETVLHNKKKKKIKE